MANQSRAQQAREGATAASPASLAGAWELVSDSQVGLTLFTERHFTMTVTDKQRPKSGSDELCDAEAAAAFRAMNSAGGTYEISGTHIVFHRLVNRHPNWTGQDFTWAFRLEGNELILKDYRWRRVG